MFYWTVGDRAVVLTDEEEDKLLVRAGFSPDERIDFFIATESGARLQERLGRYLEDVWRSDPEQFALEFLKRNGDGPEQLDQLRALVDAYARTSRRVQWGRSRLPVTLIASVDIWLGQRPDVISLTILAPMGRWFWRVWHPIGEISFPSAEIERFYGDDRAFFIATSRLLLRFDQHGVQIVQLPDDPRDSWLPP